MQNGPFRNVIRNRANTSLTFEDLVRSVRAFRAAEAAARQEAHEERLAARWRARRGE